MLRRKNISVLFFSLLLFEASGQNKPVYECIYRLSLPHMPVNMGDQLPLTASAVFDYKIITNGDWYLMYGKKVSITIENTGFREDSVSGYEDSALIRKPDKFYNLSLKTVQPLSGHHFSNEIGTASAENKEAFIQKSDDSSTFFLSSKYPPFLTPFPHYIGNKHGVIEIKNSRFSCSLISEKKIDFDFQRYEAAIKKFRAISEPMVFPF